MPNSLLHRINRWRSNDKLRAYLTEGVLSAFIVLLPFQWHFPPISLFIMILGAIFLFFAETSYFNRWAKNSYFLVVLAYYIWVAIGLTYTDYPREGGADLQVQIALAAWPIGLVALHSVTKSMVERLTMLFVRAMGVSVLLCLILATQAYLKDGETSHFFYKNLAAWPLVPQHYMAMYISFALLILVNRWVKADFVFKTYQYLETITLGALLLAGLSLLSVRNQFLALPIALLPLIRYALAKKVLGKRGIRIGLISGFALLALIAILPGTQRRIVETYHEIRSINHVVDKKQTNHRVYIWKYTSEVIEENWMWGTGTGGGNKALHEKLLSCEAKFWNGEGVYYLYEKEYNAHNAYLQAWMTHGIIGFILLCSILLIPLWKSIRKGEALTTAFLLLTIISFSTESMLERQAGVLWFAVFYTLLVVVPKRESVIPENKLA